MKKIITSLITFFVMAFPLTVFALNIGAGSGAGGTSYLESARKSSGFGQATETTFASNLGLVVNIVLSFSGVIFMSLMVYAGYLWMTARGEASQIEKSQNMIRSAIIGMIITVGAYSITNFIVPTILERVAS